MEKEIIANVFNNGREVIAETWLSEDGKTLFLKNPVVLEMRETETQLALQNQTKAMEVRMIPVIPQHAKRGFDTIEIKEVSRLYQYPIDDRLVDSYRQAFGARILSPVMLPPGMKAPAGATTIDMRKPPQFNK